MRLRLARAFRWFLPAEARLQNSSRHHRAAADRAGMEAAQQQTNASLSIAERNVARREDAR